MKKATLSNWFPFALVASGLVAIGAGIRSGFKTASDAKKDPPPPAPPPAQARFP